MCSKKGKAKDLEKRISGAGACRVDGLRAERVCVETEELKEASVVRAEWKLEGSSG